MTILKVLLIALSFSLYCVNTWSASDIHSKKSISTERTTIISELKLAIGKELEKPMKLKLSAYRVQANWAFLQGVILDVSGKPMDYRNTQYQEAIDQGYFDDWFCALLQKTRGKWRVVTYQVGATDIPYLDWPKRFGAPQNLIRKNAD